MTRRRAALTMLAALAALGLPACRPDALTAMPAITDLQDFMGEPQDITAANYAAADQLAYQSEANISRDTDILITPLYDMNDPSRDYPFAYVIPQNIGTRLSQLGYSVRLDGNAKPVVVPIDQNAPPSPARVRGWRQQQAMLGGSYTITGPDVLISLRLTELSTAAGRENRGGRLLGAYEYKLDKNMAVRKLLRPPKGQETTARAADQEPMNLNGDDMPGRAMPETVVKQPIPDSSAKR